MLELLTNQKKKLKFIRSYQRQRFILGSKNDLSSGFLLVGKVKIHIELTNSLSLQDSK